MNINTNSLLLLPVFLGSEAALSDIQIWRLASSLVMNDCDRLNWSPLYTGTGQFREEGLSHAWVSRGANVSHPKNCHHPTLASTRQKTIEGIS